MSRRKHTAFLPPTPCPPEMRDSIVMLADSNNVSIAEVVRQAVTLFLSENVSISDNLVSIPNLKKESNK
ncbi:hypothetical protein [Thiocapsa sp. N5-Cardenillas]|uniref:hypothetical protein n=1 Tax=Thiocapsa sp. N5-Cardenillas TaxID=3137397 RepID=UPI0035ADA7D9